MEEILASIRRIIESNEPAADNAMSSSLDGGYIEEDIEDPEEVSFAPELAANDRGRPLDMPRAFEAARDLPSVSPLQGERALSLADVAARVRAASVRQQDAGPQRPVATPSMSAMPAAAQPEPAPTRQEPVMEKIEALSSSAMLRPSIEPMSQPEPPRVEPPRFTAMMPQAPADERPAEQAMPTTASEDTRSLPARIEETASLLSAEAGAQVAQSFNELAAVFNGLEHRSVEEMAQDMLRPMLQEWLDDNLPTLVERMVREEIERVARGPRR